MGVGGVVVMVVEVTEPPVMAEAVDATDEVDEDPVELVGMLPESGVYRVVS